VVANVEADIGHLPDSALDGALREIVVGADDLDGLIVSGLEGRIGGGEGGAEGGKDCPAGEEGIEAEECHDYGG
jgi:hypothetical protein